MEPRSSSASCHILRLHEWASCRSDWSKLWWTSVEPSKGKAARAWKWQAYAIAFIEWGCSPWSHWIVSWNQAHSSPNYLRHKTKSLWHQEPRAFCRFNKWKGLLQRRFGLSVKKQPGLPSKWTKCKIGLSELYTSLLHCNTRLFDRSLHAQRLNKLRLWLDHSRNTASKGSCSSWDCWSHTSAFIF